MVVNYFHLFIYADLTMSEQSETQDAQPVSRRKFLGAFVGGVAAAVTAALAVPLVGYIVYTGPKPGAKQTISLTPTSEIPLGTPTFVTYQQTVTDGWVTAQQTKAAWVVTSDGKNFEVFDSRCTHLG